MTQAKTGILVIQSMGLGDMLFALPVLSVLKNKYPEKRITFLTHERHRDLLNLIPGVDDVITYRTKSFWESCGLLYRIRQSRYEMCFVLNPILKGSLIAFLSGAAQRIGYVQDYEKKQTMLGLEKFLLTHPYQPRQEEIHEAERYLDLLRFYGLPVRQEDVRPRLRLFGVQQESGTRLLERMLPDHHGPLIIINLGAAWEMRLWPEDRLAETADWLVETYDARIVFAGGETERAPSRRIQDRMRHEISLDVAGASNLVELASILQNCDLFMTSDTGTLHIAAALDVPILALYGPGNLKKVSPLSPKSRVLFHGMPCSPCSFQYTDRCQNNLCMKEITVEEVKTALQEMLTAPRRISDPAPTPPSNKKSSSLSKVLYLQSTSEIGGTDITLLRTLQALDKSRFEPHVLLPKEGPFVEAYQKAGCKIHILSSMKKMTRRKGALYPVLFLLGYWPVVFQIASLIRRERIRLVHTNTIHNLYGCMAAKIAGVRHVWHIREIVVQSRFMRALEVFLVKKFSNRFIVMDNAIAEMFLGKTHGFPKNIVKLYDGIDLQKFHPGVSGSRIRKELGIGEREKLVGTVCRLDPWKGLDLFIEAAAKTRQKNPEVKFLLCGGEIEGHEGYEKRLREKIRALNLEKHFYITGWKYFGDAIPEVYGALDISVQTPVFPEPYGLANLESMATGVPHVSIRSGGPVELCADGITGRLVNQDATAVAGAILDILADPTLAQAMGAEGRKRTERLFDFQKCTRQLELLYDQVLK